MTQTPAQRSSAKRQTGVLADDYTMVMPTYNRPDDLRRNLMFQDAQGLPCRVLVLDSSRPEIKEANRNSVGSVDLDVEYISYDPATHPFDKFSDGVSRVATRYASLCADDDLLLLGGLAAALRALEREPRAVVAHGYYFLFGHLRDTTNLDLTTMLYASPSIVDTEPLERLRTLMRSYQALTYGVFRTPVMRTMYQATSGLQSLMFRELISGALPALDGHLLRVPEFYMARAHATGDDAARKRWHPLEWFMRDGADLLAEYADYRRVLSQHVVAAGSTHSLERIERLIDMIHMGYLSKHLPTGVQDQLLTQELAGRGIDDYWNDQQLQQALVEAHNSEFTAAVSPARLLTSLVADSFPRGSIDPATGNTGPWPLVTTTVVRDYRFYAAFLDNKLSQICAFDGSHVKELVNTLDLYTPV